MKIISTILFAVMGSLLLLQATEASPGCKQKHHHADPKVEAMIETAKRQRNHQSCKQCIVIDTYFWTFHGTGVEDAENNPTKEMMKEQFDVLVDRFSETPFTFRLLGNRIIQNDKFHTEDMGANSDQIVTDFRIGGQKVLNAYFGGAGHGSFATLAAITLDDDEFDVGDATFTDITTVPGLPANQDENEADRSLGNTLVHEVGHWMGLGHTFDSNFDTEAPNYLTELLCSDQNLGDYVDDTPKSMGGGGCPIGQDSCPGQGGPDPIHNYMDYTDDICHTKEDGFTPGQVQRMFILWNVFREYTTKCNQNDSALFEVEFQLDAVGKNRWALQATDGSFYFNDQEQGWESLQEFAGTTLNFDICLMRGKDYTFTVFDDTGTGSTACTVKLDGSVVERLQLFGAEAKVNFPVPVSGNPTIAPAPTRVPTPRPSPQPTTLRDTFVTLELFFTEQTEDVRIKVQTMVPITETPEVVGVTYSYEIAERDGADGISGYELYNGDKVSQDSFQFRGSVNGYKRFYHTIEKNSQPTPAPKTPVPTEGGGGIVPVPPSVKPTPAPAPTRAPTPRPSLRPTTLRDSFITLELFFTEHTEDVRIKVETLVPITETPEVMYETPYGFFQEATHKDTTHVVTFPVSKGVTYSFEFEERNGADGISGYELYNGDKVFQDAFQFRGGINGYKAFYHTIKKDPVTGFCFSAQTTVLTKHRGQVYMNELHLGDHVLIEDGSYSPVYAFGHRDEHSMATFIQLLPSRLELSFDHMVRIEGKGFVPAHMVQVGDTLSDGSTVSKIQMVKRIGVYNPFTASGTIAVNGVLCSNYISLQGSDVFTILGTSNVRTGVTFQWLSHAAVFPLRLWCHWIGASASLSANGWSTWSQTMYGATKVFLSLNDYVMAILFLPLVLLLGLFHVVEMLLVLAAASSHSIVILLCAIIASRIVVMPSRDKPKN